MVLNATDRHAHFAHKPEAAPRAAGAAPHVLEPTRLAGEVALLDQVVQETRIGARSPKSRLATHPQRLVDGAFELTVLLFNVAVLVRHSRLLVVASSRNAASATRSAAWLRAPVGIQR